MRTFKKTALLLLALSPMVALAAVEANIDASLVGDWQGQRDAQSACQFQVRSVKRMSDGHYVISYFSDASKTHKTAEEKGLWWAFDKTLYMQPPNSGGKPEAYRYFVIDKNTVRFENVEADLTAECPADHTLIDSRVTQE